MGKGNFDIDKYRTTRKEIEQLLKTNHCNWETDEGFILDGILDPIEYSKQKFKVLFILGEYYDHEKDKMIDIEEQPKNDFWRVGLQRFKTAKAIPFLLRYIYIYEKDVPKDIDKGFFKASEENKNELQKHFKKGAVIDIKKVSASKEKNKMDEKEILKAAEKDRDILIKQIESISPDLIVICSVIVRKAILKEGIISLKKNGN